MRRFYRILSGIILVAGLAGAGLVYLANAENDPDGEGFSSAFDPAASKMYIHNMRVFGGMANVYADEFVRWFDGLWRGKPLAYTVACITLFVSAAMFHIAGRLPLDITADAPEDAQ